MAVYLEKTENLWLRFYIDGVFVISLCPVSAELLAFGRAVCNKTVFYSMKNQKEVDISTKARWENKILRRK